jgi:hypothetical protein
MRMPTSGSLKTKWSALPPKWGCLRTTCARRCSNCRSWPSASDGTTGTSSRRFSPLLAWCQAGRNSRCAGSRSTSSPASICRSCAGAARTSPWCPPMIRSPAWPAHSSGPAGATISPARARVLVGVHGLPDAQRARARRRGHEPGQEQQREGRTATAGILGGAMAGGWLPPSSPACSDPCSDRSPRSWRSAAAWLRRSQRHSPLPRAFQRTGCTAAKFEVTGLLDRLEHGERLEPPPAPWRRRLQLRLFGQPGRVVADRVLIAASHPAHIASLAAQSS